MTEILVVEIHLALLTEACFHLPSRGFSNTGNCHIVSMPLSLLGNGTQNVRQAAHSQGFDRGLRSTVSGFLISAFLNSSLNQELVA